MNITRYKNISLHDTPCQVPSYILIAFMPLFLLCVHKTAYRIYNGVFKGFVIWKADWISSNIQSAYPNINE